MSACRENCRMRPQEPEIFCVRVRFFDGIVGDFGHTYSCCCGHNINGFQPAIRKQTKERGNFSAVGSIADGGGAQRGGYGDPCRYWQMVVSSTANPRAHTLYRTCQGS